MGEFRVGRKRLLFLSLFIFLFFTRALIATASDQLLVFIQDKSRNSSIGVDGSADDSVSGKDPMVGHELSSRSANNRKLLRQFCKDIGSLRCCSEFRLAGKPFIFCFSFFPTRGEL